MNKEYLQASTFFFAIVEIENEIETQDSSQGNNHLMFRGYGPKICLST